MNPLLYSGGVPVFQYPDVTICFTGAGNIDADGCPHSYNPGDTGLDSLADAQDGDGNWCGIAVDDEGSPYIQGPLDPAPGYYVSTTSYEWPQYSTRDPRRYVDAETVPYIVVTESLRLRCRGILLGCAATIHSTLTGLSVEAVVADLGPRVGEFSMAAAKALGVDPSPRTGGDQRLRFYCQLRPGTPAQVNGVTYALVPELLVREFRRQSPAQVLKAARLTKGVRI